MNGWQLGFEIENSSNLSEISPQKRKMVITLLGHHKVGKSAITNSYLNIPFEDTMMTLGASFKFKDLEYNSRQFRLQIVDIPGQDSYENIRKQYIRGSNGAIIVFDLTQNSSFRNLIDWVKEFSSVNTSNPKPFIIVGNKSDLLDQREVKLSDVRRFLTDIEQEPINQMVFKGYFETSAKTGENVKSTLKLLIDAIIEVLTASS